VFEQKLLATEDLMASLQLAGEAARNDLEDAQEIQQHNSVADQLQELQLQLQLSLAAIEDDMANKESGFASDERCLFIQEGDMKAGMNDDGGGEEGEEGQESGGDFEEESRGDFEDTQEIEN